MNELDRTVQKYLRPAHPGPHAEPMLRRAAFVPELRGVNESKRQIIFVSSTEDVDRYGDIIRVSGWQTKNYMRNPVFLFAHKSAEPPVGRCVSIHTETTPAPALVQVIEFADKKTYAFADTIYNLYRNKFLHAVSVGFRPLVQPEHILDENNEWTGGYEFVSQELLELSAVPLPANPAAVARAVDAGIVTRDLALRVFAGSEDDDEDDAARIVEPAGPDPDAVALARETLATYAAKFCKQPVQCSDEQAVQRARVIASLASVDRSLGQLLPFLLPFQPPENVAKARQFLAEDCAAIDLLYNAVLDVEAEDFLQQLTTPDQTLDSWLESLNTD